MEAGPLTYPAKGSFPISTAWTSTSPWAGSGFLSLGSTALGGKATRAISVGVTGNLQVIMLDGSTGIIAAPIAGVMYPIRAIGLSSANTATGIQGWY